MYFQCTEAHEVESLHPGLTTSLFFKDIDVVFPKYAVGTNISDIGSRLSEYYKRQLSFPADIIDAFTGIINAANNSRNIQNELRDHAYYDGTLTQFYGVLVYYDKRNPDTLRISFLIGLNWSVKDLDGVGTTASSLFPSWTWASVKAAQPPDQLGTFQPVSNAVPGIKTPWRGIDVQICHRTRGLQSMSDLSEHEYKDYHPYFDIKTWVQKCPVCRTASQAGTFELLGIVYSIVDGAAVERGEVHAVCLDFDASAWQLCHHMCTIRGLLVVEVEPGLYRRIGNFSTAMEVSDFGLSDREARRLYESFRSKPGESEEYRRERKKREDSWLGPSMLEKASWWQRRTMRLV